MRRFSFSLQSILRMREHEEREVEHRLAEVTGRCVVLEQEISELTTRKQSSFGELPQDRRSDVTYRLYHAAFVRSIDVRVRRLRSELTSNEEQRAQVQEEFRQARARRKAIEELRKRREQEHYERERRIEDGRLDEIGGTLYIRRRLETGRDLSKPDGSVSESISDEDRR